MGRHSPHDVRLATGDCTPDNSVQNGNGTEIGETHYGLVSCQLFGKGINLGYGDDIRYIEEFLAKNVPLERRVLETVESMRKEGQLLQHIGLRRKRHDFLRYPMPQKKFDEKFATLTEEKLQAQLREFIVNTTGDPKYAEYNLEYCEEYIKYDTLPE